MHLLLFVLQFKFFVWFFWYSCRKFTLFCSSVCYVYTPTQMCSYWRQQKYRKHLLIRVENMSILLHQGIWKLNFVWLWKIEMMFMHLVFVLLKYLYISFSRCYLFLCLQSLLFLWIWNINVGGVHTRIFFLFSFLCFVLWGESIRKWMIGILMLRCIEVLLNTKQSTFLFL